MSMRIAYLNIIIIAIGLPFLLFMYFAPFSFFVDIDYVDHQDVCAGEKVQTVLSMRKVRWGDTYEGHIIAELHQFDDELKYETTIRRDDTFIYQKSDDEVIYQIKWSDNLPAGEYGVASLVTIEPGFRKQNYRSEEDQRFTVYECE